MADVKISQLAEAVAVSDNDVLPEVSNGVTLKAKLKTLKDYIIGIVDNTGLGATVSAQIKTLSEKMHWNTFNSNVLSGYNEYYIKICVTDGNTYNYFDTLIIDADLGSYTRLFVGSREENGALLLIDTDHTITLAYAWLNGTDVTSTSILTKYAR